MPTCRLYGAYTLETLLATAFGRYVAVQKGEANQLTKAAGDIFRLNEDGHALSPDTLLLALCVLEIFYVQNNVLHFGLICTFLCLVL